MQYQLVGQILQHVKRVRLQLVDVEVFDTLVLRELTSCILLIANLTHDHDCRTVALDVIIQIGSRHMLVLIQVTNVTAELGTVELCMCLQLS